MRNIKFILVPALFSLFIVSPSYAEQNGYEVNNTTQDILKETQSSERWEYIMGKTKSGYQGFLDIERFEIDGSKRDAWTKVVFAGEGVERDHNGKKYRAIYSITNRIYDCSNLKAADIKSIDYDSHGNSYTTDFKKLYSKYPEKKWISIIPGSLGEYLLNFICEYKQ